MLCVRFRSVLKNKNENKGRALAKTQDEASPGFIFPFTHN